MSIDDDLEAFYRNDIASVVSNPDQFRRKLDIGADAFKYLSTVDNLREYATVVTSGAGVAGFAYAGWITSIGTFGQIGVALGLVATPVGWIAAGGTAGAAAILLTHRLFKRAKKGVVTEIPHFINSPLDILAASLCDLLAPILLKIALADDELAESEVMFMKRYFTEEWGLNSDYVDSLLMYDAAHIAQFNWSTLKNIILEIEKSGDIKYDTLVNEILRNVEEVMLADGIVKISERHELTSLKTALGEKEDRFGSDRGLSRFLHSMRNAIERLLRRPLR